MKRGRLSPTVQNLSSPAACDGAVASDAQHSTAHSHVKLRALPRNLRRQANHLRFAPTSAVEAAGVGRVREEEALEVDGDAAAAGQNTIYFV